MDYALLKQPYEISFAGNPLQFIWQLYPYDQQNSGDITFTIRVLIENSFGSGTGKEIYVQKMYPDAEGKIQFDASTIVNPYLEFYTPGIGLQKPVEAISQRKRFYVNVVLEAPGYTQPVPSTPVFYNVIKGGLSQEAWHYKEFFTKVIQEQKKPLLFSAAKELVDPDALKFLYWVYPYDNQANQTVTYKVYLSDGTTVEKVHTVKLASSGKWAVNCVPSGFIQSGLNAIVPEGKYPIKYSIKIASATIEAGGITAVNITNAGLLLVNGHYYDVAISALTGSGTGAKANVVVSNNVVKYITISNPGEGFNVGDTFNLPSIGSSAQMEVTAISDGSAAIDIVSEYFFNLDNRNFYEPYFLIYRNSIGGLETVRLLGQVDIAADYARQQARRTAAPKWYGAIISDENTEETFSYTADSGFMSKEQLLKLRDLFMSKEKYQYHPEPGDGRLLPIAIVTSKSKFFSNRDNLVSTQIEWQSAFINTFFTPETLMPSSRSCPAVEKFIARQLNKTTLQFLWSLEDPYDQIEVQVIIGADTYIYVYNGNAGMVQQSFANPAITDPVEITIKARTVCSTEGINEDYGAFATVILSVYANSLPVAVDDYFQVPLGFAGVLPFSVLDNDYDPDGDPIEAVAEWNLFGVGGTPAVFSVDAAGFVTIENAGVTLTGPQTFNYHIKEVGGENIVEGKVTVNFGNGPQAVYVKWIFLNVTTTSEYVEAECWLAYFSDPACTVPLDITSLGLTINAKWVAVGGVTGGDEYHFIGTGTKRKMLDKQVITLNKGIFSYHYDFTVLSGNGYVEVNP